MGKDKESFNQDRFDELAKKAVRDYIEFGGKSNTYKPKRIERIKDFIDDVYFHIKTRIYRLFGFIALITLAPLAFFIRSVFEYFKALPELFSLLCKVKADFYDFITLSHVRYAIKCIFKPQQSYILKELQISWQDKPEIMRDILFSMLVDYFERENGPSSISSELKHYEEEEPNSPKIDLIKQRIADLQKTYAWIKERPDFKEYHENYFDNVKKDNDALKIILKYREDLWV